MAHLRVTPLSCFSLLFFHFSIFVFFKNNVSSFIFLLYFFQRCFIAGISIRCRCSVEMWCPDDMARDSWDWVGLTYLWGEHASTAQIGLALAPIQIVLLSCSGCLSCRVIVVFCVVLVS